MVLRDFLDRFRPAASTSPSGAASAAVSREISASDSDVAQIRSSGLFDEAYYRALHGDSPDPVLDFAQSGWRLLRNPNPFFDTRYYLEKNPDVLESGQNPLLHYIESGEADGRRPHPDFDPAFYLEAQPDVAKAKLQPLRHYLKYGRNEGRVVAPFSTTTRPYPTETLDDYESWLSVNRLTPKAEERTRSRLAAVENAPLVSVVMPVFDPRISWLRRAVLSVQNQLYANWELCIADDCSTKPLVREYLRSLEADSRIRVRYRTVNGHISEATNEAASLANGAWLVFMDQDDELARDALSEVAFRLQDAPEADVLYSDHDKIDVDGRRYAPELKPDWSPELLLSFMYMGHLLCVRRELFDEVGRLRSGFEGAQDHDLALRLTERTQRIEHIPKVLYHWRAVAGSTARSGSDKSYGFVAGQRAVEEALERRGSDARVCRPAWAVRAACGIYSLDFPNQGPDVAVIIPTRNRADLLRRLLRSLERTTYENYRVCIVDNGSDDEETLTLLSECGHQVLRVPSPPDGFSFAHVNNEAVRQLRAQFCLFLNNDTEIVAPRWLSRMVGLAQLQGVGAVGARLLYEDDTVQHAGVVHGVHAGLPGHAFAGSSASDGGHMSLAKVTRNCAAVTAACMLTPRALFLQMGGFDEESFPVAYNDTDYCYRLGTEGHRVVYAADAELYHYEGQTRSHHDDPREEVAFLKKYADFVDPYYSEHFAKRDPTFSVEGRSAGRDDAKSVRVLLCSHSLRHEGAPLQLLELAGGLVRAGIEVIVACPEDGPLSSEYETLGIRLETIPEPALEEITSGARSGPEVVSWLSNLDCDVVLANTVLSYWVMDAAAQAGVPSLWVIHESEPPFSHLQPSAVAVAQEALRTAYQVVFVAEATRRVYWPVRAKNNMTVVYNGPDLEKLRRRFAYDPAKARVEVGIGRDELSFVIVGTVCERKGQLDLVRAVAAMEDGAIRRARFTIVGDRPSDYSQAVHEAIDELPANRRDRVRIVDETPNVGLYLRAADVGVCCSRVESFPRVIQEAMYCGLAIVTTPVFGIAEQVADGQSALFYAPGDASALAARFEELVANRSLRTRLAKNAELTLDRLPDFEAMCTEYERLIREAMWQR